MLKVAICHDSKIHLKFIEQTVKKYMDGVKEYEYLKTENPNDIFTWGRIDLLLIGVRFNGISGFEVVEKVRKKCKNVLIIFLDEDLYVFESIKYQPFRFIRKSHIEDLEEAMSSVVQKIGKRPKEYVFQCSKSQMDSVDIRDILYFESQHNDVKLVAEKREYKFRATIKSIEEQLYNYGFVRVHSGFLVNMKHIASIGKQGVEINREHGKNHIVPISRSRRNHLMTEYKKWKCIEE